MLQIGVFEATYPRCREMTSKEVSVWTSRLLLFAVGNDVRLVILSDGIANRNHGGFYTPKEYAASQ